MDRRTQRNRRGSEETRRGRERGRDRDSRRQTDRQTDRRREREIKMDKLFSPSRIIVL